MSSQERTSQADSEPVQENKVLPADLWRMDLRAIYYASGLFRNRSIYSASLRTSRT